MEKEKNRYKFLKCGSCQRDSTGAKCPSADLGSIPSTLSFLKHKVGRRPHIFNWRDSTEHTALAWYVADSSLIPGTAYAYGSLSTSRSYSLGQRHE